MDSTSSPTVWVLSSEFEPAIVGGLGTVATQLSKAMSEANVNVMVLTRNQTDSTQVSKKKGIEIVRVAKTPRSPNQEVRMNNKTLQQLCSRHFSRRPDVIHVHSLDFANAAAYLKHHYNAKLLYTCHSLAVQPGRKKNQELLFRIADRIVVPSRWLKQQIGRRYAGTANKIRVIPHGVQAVSQRTEAPLHELLFVGRFVQGKGLVPLIASLARLAKANKQVRLSIVGKGAPFAVKRLKAVARKHGVSSKVRFLGFFPHDSLQRMYASYGAVVVPSKHESFCLVALEAMANGVPLAATRNGGLQEFVNESNAQIIREVTSREISNAILEMWRNPEKTKQRVLRAKQTAGNYTWPKAAAQYKALIAEMTGPGSKKGVKRA